MTTNAEIILRIVLSIILCGLIGLEREHLHKPAGLRTNIIVGLGSTLIMLTSLYIPVLMKNTSLDPGHMAAAAITGIGFLGAGAIIQSTGSVRGLTTAAGIWLVAAIGLAVGIGYYFAAFATTVIALAVLYIIGSIESKRQIEKNKEN